MKRTHVARALAVALAAVCVFGLVASAAFASPVHTTDRFVGNADAQFTAESVGDAGLYHGNANPGTSPVDASADFYWFNQDVQMLGFGINDTFDADDDIVPTGGTYAVNTGAGYGAPVDYTGEPVVSGEGVYSVYAVGYDADAPEQLASGTVAPAFGIDKTAPSSSSDAVAAYVNGSATIAIQATDAMAGVQDIRTSVDGGPWQYTYDGELGTTTADVNISTPGMHVVSWEAFDNAGNVDAHMVSFAVFAGTTVDINASAGTHGRISPSGTFAAPVNGDQAFTITPDANYKIADVLVDGSSVGAVSSYTFHHVTAEHTIAASFAPNFPAPFKPAVSVSVKYLNSLHRRVGFTAGVTPMGVPTTVKLTIQRKSGSKWVKYATMSATLSAYQGSIVLNRTVTKKSTFRVQATDSGGVSKWITFKSK